MTRIKCLSCEKVLESKHAHDFQRCSCPNETFVDGGSGCPRIGGHDFDKIATWSEKLGAWIVCSGFFRED